LIDLDVGMSRTGIGVGPEAADLYVSLSKTPGLKPGGFHVYDGGNNNPDATVRAEAVSRTWRNMKELAATVEARGAEVPRFVCGGSPSFPQWAAVAPEDSRVECSPGTFFLNDWGYYGKFEDAPLPPAAVLLTRVISKPLPNRITLDLGYKAVASEQPVGNRVVLLNVPNAKVAWQNEEHLIVDTDAADQFQPGDLVYGVPIHICPTCNLHQELLAVVDHRVVGRWRVEARDRRLNV
ncbi:MAG: D-TA family PLP-dependent enzyme, partial [Planctomycetia bacterium]